MKKRHAAAPSLVVISDRVNHHFKDGGGDIHRRHHRQFDGDINGDDQNVSDDGCGYTSCATAWWWNAASCAPAWWNALSSLPFLWGSTARKKIDIASTASLSSSADDVDAGNGGRDGDLRRSLLFTRHEEVRLKAVSHSLSSSAAGTTKGRASVDSGNYEEDGPPLLLALRRASSERVLTTFFTRRCRRHLYQMVLRSNSADTNIGCGEGIHEGGGSVEDADELFLKEAARLLCRSNPYNHHPTHLNDDKDEHETAKAARLVHDACSQQNSGNVCAEGNGKEKAGLATAQDLIELCYSCALASHALDRHSGAESSFKKSDDDTDDEPAEDGVEASSKTGTVDPSPPSSRSMEPLVLSLLLHAAASSDRNSGGCFDDFVSQADFVRWIDGNGSKYDDPAKGPVPRIALAVPSLLERILFPPPPPSPTNSSSSSSFPGGSGSSRPVRHLMHFPQLHAAVPEIDRRCPNAIREDAADRGPIFASPTDPALFALGCMESTGFDGKWHRIFSTAEDGKSMNRLEHAVMGFEGPTVLLIKAFSDVRTGAASSTFGAFVSTPWKKTGLGGHYFGDVRCFLFVLDPIVRVIRALPPRGARGGNYVYFAGDQGIGFGTASHPRLFVEGTLDRCRFGWQDSSYEPGGTSLFVEEGNNLASPLASAAPGVSSMLDIDALEIWGTT